MTVPVDGIPGKLWRTVGLPFRLASPFAQLAKRAITRNFWEETVCELPGSGPDLDLANRADVQHPRDGAGPLNHRSYSVLIKDSQVDPVQLVEKFRTDPNRFCPTSFAAFVPDPAPTGFQEGAEYEVKLPGPWDGPVYVQEVRHDAVRLNTRVGHMEAGWIEFRAESVDRAEPRSGVEFTIESFARSGDAVFDKLYHDVGLAKTVQTQMWVTVLEAAVEASGGLQQGRINIETTIYAGADE